MKIIQISKNIYINPDQITSVEIKELKGEKRLIVNLIDRTYAVDVPDRDFMTSLMNSGVGVGEQFFSV